VSRPDPKCSLNVPTSKTIESFETAYKLDSTAADNIDYMCAIVSYVKLNQKNKAEKLLKIGQKKFPENLESVTITKIEDGLKKQPNL